VLTAEPSSHLFYISFDERDGYDVYCVWLNSTTCYVLRGNCFVEFKLNVSARGVVRD